MLDVVLRSAMVAVFASGALYAQASFAGVSDAARQQYEAEQAFCSTDKTYQDLETCRLEARNAYAEIRRGHVAELPASVYQANQLKRCEAHIGDDKLDCEARVRGAGKVEGSVEAGGILREYSKTVPADQK